MEQPGQASRILVGLVGCILIGCAPVLVLPWWTGFFSALLGTVWLMAWLLRSIDGEWPWR